MAEIELPGNRQPQTFPFDYVHSMFAGDLAKILCQLERRDICKPHADFVTALNTILVWTGA